MPEKRCADVILVFIFLTGLVWKHNQISHVVEKVLLGSKLPLLDQRCKEMTTGIPVVHLLAMQVMPEGAFPPKVPGTKYQNVPVVLRCCLGPGS